MSAPVKTSHPVVLLLAGWLVPGSAHWLLGKPGKAILFLSLIVGTFVAGMALSGFDNVYYAPHRWTMLTQFPAGAVAYVGTRLHDNTADPAAGERPRFKVGTLYTSVAGLLNVLVVMDAIHVGWMRRRGAKG